VKEGGEKKNQLELNYRVAGTNERGQQDTFNTTL